MRELSLRIFKSLTDGFERNGVDSMTVKSWLLVENTSQNDLDIIQEVVTEFNSKSEYVNVEFITSDAGVSCPNYLIRIYKI